MTVMKPQICLGTAAGCFYTGFSRGRDAPHETVGWIDFDTKLFMRNSEHNMI